MDGAPSRLASPVLYLPDSSRALQGSLFVLTDELTSSFLHTVAPIYGNAFKKQSVCNSLMCRSPFVFSSNTQVNSALLNTWKIVDLVDPWARSDSSNIGLVSLCIQRVPWFVLQQHWCGSTCSTMVGWAVTKYLPNIDWINIEIIWQSLDFNSGELWLLLPRKINQCNADHWAVIGVSVCQYWNNRLLLLPWNIESPY